VIHGFTFFLIVVEGQTAPLGVTFAVIATLFGIIWGRRKLKQQPLLLFFFVAYVVATLFFVGWGIYWQGFPEFSQVGMID
jgi:CHASE2 domain-containing sensor protein